MTFNDENVVRVKKVTSMSNQDSVAVPSAHGEVTAGTKKKAPFVWPGMLVPFVLLVSCFAAWGISTDLTAPLVNVFSSVFHMSAFQSSLVQFAYFGAYFLLAIPAAYINSKLGYKGGVVIGLSLAATGALLFFPASKLMTFGAFIAALFILAGGLSIVETSANPFVMAMGPEKTATRRLNLAQAFNPIGSNVGVLAATLFILPNIHVATAEERASMPEAELLATRSDELQAVMAPYIALGCLYAFLAISIAFVKIQKRRTMISDSAAGVKRQRGTFMRLMRNKLYSFGVVAQFCNIAAQTCIWTYIIFYVMETLGVDRPTAGWWLQGSLISFLIMRFLMVWIMGRVDPRVLMTVMASLGLIFTATGMLCGNIVGAIGIALLSGCISLMFPTIYGLALTGLGDDTKFGSAGLVMAIIGGAVVPPIQGLILDHTSAQFSFIVVLMCFAVMLGYALYARRQDLDALAAADDANAQIIAD